MPLRNSRMATGAGHDLPLNSEKKRALDDLFSATYEELRRLASSVKRGDPGQTINPTALVNEAWVKLANSPNLGAASHLHFKRIAARAMRQVLVEAARRRNSQKRGGKEDVAIITFDELLMPRAQSGKDLLALHSALEELARLDARQALMVESRFFGGLEVNEIAELLHVSEATVMRDWRAAKAWLSNIMTLLKEEWRNASIIGLLSNADRMRRNG